MRSKRLLGGICALLLAAAWFGCGKFKKSPAAAGRTVAVRQGSIEDTVEATGSVLPLNRVEIKPPIAGRMEKLVNDEGDTVKTGQILAWMSSSDRAAILDAARAQGPQVLKRWEDSYKPTPIIAPLSGVIILRNVVVGQTVDAATVLYAMSDRLVVIADVDESDIGRVKIGMPARVTLDAYPDKTDAGKVFDILYEGKNVSNVIQYQVKVDLDRVPAYYRSQMTANISFVMGRKDSAVLVPAAAVREAGGGVKQVQIPGPDGKPVTREIKTGIESGDAIEVLSGLNPGDQVIIAQGKYVPQQAAQSSPLTMGGRPSSPTGQAPKPRKGS